MLYLVIFITAYPQYAVEGFELEALDYLLKPFSFERFLKAVNRAEEKLKLPSPQEKLNTCFFVKADKKLYKVEFNTILYVEAYGDYVRIFTKEKTLLVKERLTKIEAELPKTLFQRIHRSYIISLSAIHFIEGNQMQIDTIKLPIATTYKEELMLKLKNQ